MPHAVPLPRFPVDLAAPDLAPWRAGTHGLAGVHSFTAAAPGPHVALLALMHGNEIAGAILLDRLLRAGLRPARGRLSLAFLNLDAFNRFDPAQPTLSRFIDEDLNRVWDPALLDGTARSRERDRARALRPFLDTVDVALDLHSMLWDGDPLLLCGQTARGRALALALGVPGLVVADAGHPGGLRLIDYPRFAAPDGGPTALLLEAGPHWRAPTLDTTEAVVSAFLRHLGVVDPAGAAPPAPAVPPRLAEVTHAITPATTGFAFVQPWRSGTVLARRNTVIAFDGPTEIRTPYDECLLVMPSLRASRGHVAVRLARFV
ncbi:MAG: peptidase M14 [Acetobacteraceae bacterium]